MRFHSTSIAKFLGAAMLSWTPIANAALFGHEAEALSKATVSLVRAVETGEKAAHGKTIGVEFDIEHDRPIWEVKVLNASGVSEYKVDANSAQIVKVEEEHMRGRLTTFFTGITLSQLNEVKLPLSEAVSMAERQLGGGKAVKVQVEHEHGGIQYDVFVRGKDRTEHTKIEASSGQTR